MFAKISLTAAILLMAMPPIACASYRDASNVAPVSRRAFDRPVGIILAQDNDSQDSQSNTAESDQNDTDNDNDSDSNDSANNQNDNDQNDGNQMDQSANGDGQTVPPTVLGGPDNDNGQQAPQYGYPQPVNPQ
jgi:hypothetical protein